MTTLQDRTQGQYRAVVLVPASGFAAPKMDVTNNVTTAEVELTSLVDQTGAALGTNANPIYTTGSTGTGGAPYQATAIAGSQMGLAVVAATALTVPATATFALIQVEGTDVRWRDDGTNPTASVGFRMYSGSAPQLFSGDLSVVKFIQTAATATINVAYYK